MEHLTVSAYLCHIRFLSFVQIEQLVFFIFGLCVAVAAYWLFYLPYNWEKSINITSTDLADSIRRKKKYISTSKWENKPDDFPPPYPNGWYSVLESSNVSKGETVSVSLLGENLVVFRTLENKVHILDAYCPHMGANLGIGGQVVGDNIQCPFHKWIFRGDDGKCIKVPYSSCAYISAFVRKWISRDVNDFIFVWYHTDATVIPWEIPVIKQIGGTDYSFHGRNEFLVNCHIQDIPENGADLAHFNAVHSNFFSAGDFINWNNFFAIEGGHRWHALWRTSNKKQEYLAAICLSHSIEIFSKFHLCTMNVKGLQVGPSYVQLHLDSFLGDVIVQQTVTPVEELVQKVVHRFYASRIMAPFMKLFIVGESTMFERDMKIWNHKSFRLKPWLVNEDSTILSFRNWYFQFYSPSNTITFDFNY